MNVTELLFLGDENIEYDQLSEAILHALAIAEDPAVASSALQELKRRGTPLFSQAVSHVLNSPATDSYLKAYALELSFSRNPANALRYIEQHMDTFDRVVWATVVELMVMEAQFFLQHTAASCEIYRRFQALESRPAIDARILDPFQATYSQPCS